MTWTQSGNIKGASGTPGASGASGATGASGASGGTGASGPGFYRVVATLTEPTNVGASGSTDYVYLLSVGSGGDASYSSVTALLHGNGTNNSTTITDSSSLASNWTALGNAKLNTTTKKFGTASISLDGTNSYIRASAASSNFAFGSLDFTVEFFVNFNATGGQILYDSRPSGANGFYPMIWLNNGKIAYFVNSAEQITGTTTISTATWYHVAISRSGTSTKLFVDGTQEGSTYTDSSVYLSASSRPVMGVNGTSLNNFFANAFIDEIRVTRGVSRYSSNFTAPTAEFAESAPPVGTPTLPTATSNSNRYAFRNLSGSAVIVGASGTQRINGATGGFSLANNTAVELISDGASGWHSL